MRFTLRDAHLIDATTDIARGALTIDGMQIQAVECTEYLDSQEDSIVDATGMIVVPGFIDVHTHGGGGYNLHTTDAGEIRAYARWVPETGVTSFLIAVVGVPGSLPEQQGFTWKDRISAWQSVEHINHRGFACLTCPRQSNCLH